MDRPGRPEPVIVTCLKKSNMRHIPLLSDPYAGENMTMKTQNADHRPLSYASR